MNEESLNLSIRKFLKVVGVKSQHQIELAVSNALANGKLSGKKSLPVTMHLRITGVDLDVRFEDTIELE